jgi:hypothetical protein
VLNVDGQVVATHKIPHTIAFLMVADETFDVGIDTRTAVNDKDYQVPFRFNGKINKLTFDLGPIQLSEEDQKTVAKLIGRAKDYEGRADRLAPNPNKSPSAPSGQRLCAAVGQDHHGTKLGQGE